MTVGVRVKWKGPTKTLLTDLDKQTEIQKG